MLEACGFMTAFDFCQNRRSHYNLHIQKIATTIFLLNYFLKKNPQHHLAQFSCSEDLQ
jgi:hypothetical protein